MKLIVFVLFLALSIAYAGQVNLKSSDHGLIGAMKRGGCSARWLAYVMSTNEVTEAQLTRLPQNLPIALPDECRGNAVPPSEWWDQASKQIIRHQKTVAEVQNLRKQNTAILDLSLKNERDLKIAWDTVQRLREEIVLLKKGKDPRKVFPPQATASGSIWRGLGYIGLGILCTLLGGFLWFRWYTAGREIFPKKINHIHVGKIVTFGLQSATGHYKCPHCSEAELLPHNFERHLMRTHPSLRVTIVDKTVAQPS